MHVRSVIGLEMEANERGQPVPARPRVSPILLRVSCCASPLLGLVSAVRAMCHCFVAVGGVSDTTSVAVSGAFVCARLPTLVGLHLQPNHAARMHSALTC